MRPRESRHLISMFMTSAIRVEPDMGRPLYVPPGYFHWQYNVKRCLAFAALQSLL